MGPREYCKILKKRSQKFFKNFAQTFLHKNFSQITIHFFSEFRMGQRQLVVAVLGVFVSAYSVYVEGQKREDEDYEAMCDITSWSSCTSAFENPVGTGFGFLCDITGEGMYAHQGGSFF